MSEKNLSWYVYIAEQSYGPVTLDELITWYSEGRFQPTDYVYGPGYEEWLAASEVVELNPGESPEDIPPESQSVQSVEDEEEKPEETLKSDVPEPQSIQSVEDEEEKEKPEETVKSPGKKRKKLKYIILAIILLIFMGAVAWYFTSLSGGKKKSSDMYLNSINVGKTGGSDTD